eukprot:scaffold85665_cov75-Attheya_sp.AAC.3
MEPPVHTIYGLHQESNRGLITGGCGNILVLGMSRQVRMPLLLKWQELHGGSRRTALVRFTGVGQKNTSRQPEMGYQFISSGSRLHIPMLSKALRKRRSKP